MIFYAICLRIFTSLPFSPHFALFPDRAHSPHAFHVYLVLTSLFPPLKDSSKATDPDNNAEAMAQSAGSAAEKDVGADASAPYGTRSRNRHGNARPNYAEDKDIEMDNYDYYHDKKDGEGPKKSTRHTAATSNGDVPRGQAASRKAAVAADDAKVATSNGNKDAHPSTTTSSNATTINTNGTQAPAATHTSRKRKAAGGATNQTSSTTAASRRGGHGAAAASTAWPESNLLTFENCHGMPSKGRLVADDGTVLQPNGKLGTFFSLR